MKESKTGWACGTHDGNKNVCRISVEKHEGKNRLEIIDVDVRILLK
jgi:hypothetical protein